MKKVITSICFSLLMFSCNSQTNKSVEKVKQSTKIKVYLLGTFHFNQTDSTYNILDDKHQKSIIELCKIIENQKPEKVFVERQPEFESQNNINGLYNSYLENNKLKYKNEIFQVGFRVAKNLNHSKIYQCDNPGLYGTNYFNAKKYAEENGQLDILNAKAKGTVVRYDETIDEDSLMQKSSLLDYIKWINSDKVMKTSHAGYIANYPLIGSTDFYNYDDDNTLIGAELTAGWYRRNIMIYTKIINQLDYSEKAIFIIIGADHVPILRNLFRDNPYFEVMETKKWLQ